MEIILSVVFWVGVAAIVWSVYDIWKMKQDDKKF